VCLLHLPPWAGARLAERGRGMPYDRPCGVAGAKGWPAKIKAVPEVLEWLLGLKECLNGWGCLQLMLYSCPRMRFGGLAERVTWGIGLNS
ncbi:MAG: hypothetical protein JXC36_07600, partial [Candidatus Atribacteria bacterium]|nr:hypothetical protein [Candidatus Atribacteria bacterium]